MVILSREYNIGPEKSMIGNTILIKLLSLTYKPQQLLLPQKKMIIKTSTSFIFCRNMQKRIEEVFSRKSKC
jgi:hypothetical protein